MKSFHSIKISDVWRFIPEYDSLSWYHNYSDKDTTQINNIKLYMKLLVYGILKYNN